MLVIFDVDGTLIDDGHVYTKAIREVLQSNGLPDMTDEAILAHMGFDAQTVIMAFFGTLPDDRRDAAGAQAIRKIREKDLQTHPLFPGTLEMLKTVSELPNCKVALLSNKEHEALTVVVKSLFKDWNFFQVIGASKERAPKPAPDGILHLMESAGAKPEETFMVGDTIVDVQTGHAANVQTIACTWGFHPRAQLEAEKPRHLVTNHQELVAILEQAAYGRGSE
ncbi:Phosphoglycolate phosphatase [Giardia muris]|uniref:Phosphoglycolate phosphatase n=1 Tax=Giardia muris TaxID=5742 RepID=A0A4Z1T8M1_GIAMU|nr:Phosphoglycolate phosphatase [Giardia muris]|eukprot:TNJ29477.1 Phosphoglycolate phosphatase [Giardia muris]